MRIRIRIHNTAGYRAQLLNGFSKTVNNLLLDLKRGGRERDGGLVGGGEEGRLLLGEVHGVGELLAQALPHRPLRQEAGEHVHRVQV
jgi:hypothetical protein